MDVTYQFMKKRSTFGRQTMFCEAGPEMCDSIVTNPDEQKNYILRNPIHQIVQHTPNFSQQFINTIRAEYHTTGANHSEGGWAKDINIHDPEATQRYRRKVEKDDSYIRCVMSRTPGIEHYIYQNNAIDMYQTYYAEIPPVPPVEKNSCRTVNVYRDKLKRPISSISWQQEEGHRFAVSYADLDFYREPLKPINASIWDVDYSVSPEIELEPGEPMFDLQFSSRDPHMLIGGLVTGEVVVFDLREGVLPVGISPRHVAHRDLVRKVIFIASKPGTEFFSTGPDGVCKWWDTRRLDKPTDEMIIDLVSNPSAELNMETALAVSALEYEPTIPTRFMVGTENGLVISGNRKGKTPMEKLPYKFEAHVGPVGALQRNPGFPKIFLTTGDYTMRIWSEDSRDSPVLWSTPQRHRFTSGTWSPTRYSLISLTSASGILEIWDLLRRQNEPIITMRLCDDPLTTQCFQEKGSLNAVGNQSGMVTLVELSHFLTESARQDKSLLFAVFERESKREHILEARLREIKLKLRQAEEQGPQVSMTDLDTTVGDRDLIEATNDYFAQLKKEQALLWG